MARGFVPPGYRYLGPGNDLNRGEPTNEADALARTHDEAYEAILQAGGRPYTQWSPADQAFFENLQVNDIATAAAKGLFGLKKTLNRTGLIGSTTQSNLRGREDMRGFRNNVRQGPNGLFETAAERRRREQRERNEHEGATEERRRRFRTEGTDLEGAIIAANDDARTSLANLPGGEDSVPDLSDLLPDAGDTTQSGGDSRGRLPPGARMNNDTNMDPPGGQQMALMSSGDGFSMQSKETPITDPPSITYGLQETHTTILPWDGWLGIFGADYTAPIQVPIRMNAVSDMIPITTQTSPTAPTGPTVKGIYGSKMTASFGTSYVGFPANQASASTDPTERPAWREFWYQLYDYYTVLKCHWEIIIENPINSGGQLPLLVGVQYDSYSDTATSTGNVMPQTRLVEALSYKNMQWYRVDGQSSVEQQGRDNNIQVIKGTYMPGQIKRNIVNDGDVKTWTKTDGTLPTLKDLLTINFWLHPLASSSSSGVTYGAANMQINLKYVVQFKDLKLQARYPNTLVTNQDIQLNLNESPTATGNPLQLPNT